MKVIPITAYMTEKNTVNFTGECICTALPWIVPENIQKTESDVDINGHAMKNLTTKHSKWT